MATKLTGMLNLSRIPKDLIFTNKAGESVIWIDVVKKITPSQYGHTHDISVYDKNARQAVYLAELKPQEFGKGIPQQAAPANNYRQPAPAPNTQTAPATENNSDLPW